MSEPRYAPLIEPELLALLVKRGLVSAKATMEQAADLARELERDFFVWKRRCEVAPRDPEFPAMIDGMTEAIASLTPEELADLKERVGVVAKFKSKGD